MHDRKIEKHKYNRFFIRTLHLYKIKFDMKAIVLYYSYKGKTARFAREIAMYLWSKGLHVSLSSLSDFEPARIKETDFLITGCWTCGWFVVGQHPHKTWCELSKPLSGIVPPEQTLFFTTYKIRTGSMFNRMKKVMQIPAKVQSFELRSRTGMLTADDKLILDALIYSKTNQ